MPRAGLRHRRVPARILRPDDVDPAEGTPEGEGTPDDGGQDDTGSGEQEGGEGADS